MDLNNNKPPKFLELLADDILVKYADNLQNLTIIFPNRRAGLFLEKALLKKIKKPIWLPNTLGFDDFLQNHFNKEYSSDLELRVGLFKCYNQVFENHKDFPEFLKWSSTLISDFNDITESLTSPQQLLKNLIEVRKLENWNPEDGREINVKKEFFSFWDKLPKLYDTYLKLFKSGELFSRSYAEMVLALELKKETYQSNRKLVFAGFNALSKAEQQIFSIFKSTEIAEFYWDIDTYYYQNLMHEAAAPLKSVLNFLKIKSPNFLTSNLSQNSKEIEIIGTAGNFSQLKLVGNILENIPKNELHKTAIVLCNPDLSSQLLTAIPQKIESLNISLGFPIKGHPAFHFFEQIIEIWRDSELKKLKSQKPIITLKQLQQFLDNDFFKKFNEQEEINSISKYFIKNGITFIDHKILKSLTEKVKFNHPLNRTLISFLEHIVSPKPNKINLSYFFIEFEKVISNHINRDTLTSEVFKTLWEQILDLEEKFVHLKLAETPENYSALFTYLLSQIKIDLIGEPLEGIQIIGLLETRNLDFENLIFVSVNEGVIPSAKKLESLIPYDLRKGFGLPTYEHHDGIFSYHFYRSIQRSKKVWLLYNALTDGMGKGEKSRFIYQIEHEKELSKFITQNTIHNPPFSIENPKHVEGYKNEQDHLALLKYLTQSGLSPSAFNTFLGNPLEFYFRYVKGIKEADSISEFMEASTIGDVVHDILQNIYENFKTTLSTKENLIEGRKNTPNLLDLEYSKRFGHLPKISGKNIILKKVIQTFIEGVINLDLKNPNFSIVKLEETLEHFIEIKEEKIKLKGKADRIDLEKTNYRIIDYKTGYTDPKEFKIDSVEELFGDEPKPKALQLMFYGYLFFKSQKPTEGFGITSGIISTQKISLGLQNLTIDGKESLTKIDFLDFESHLSLQLEKLINLKEFKEELLPKYAPFFQ